MTRPRFDPVHRLLKDGTLAIEGFETPVWVGKNPNDLDKLKSKAIMADVLARLSAG